MEQFPSLNPEQERSQENGRNVEVLIKFIRHGERDPDGNLTDYGRKITRQMAQESGITSEDFGAVKAIGSSAGPVGESGMQRSLETADIYAKEIAGDEAFVTRINKMLSYDTLVTPSPYDHNAIYRENLPENYNELSDEEKVVAAKHAHTAALDYLMSLDTPEAQAFKAECAGAMAYVIDHYQKVSGRLKENSKVMIPAGTHGGVMEFILEQALVRKDQDGNVLYGLEKLEEIGGAFMPSEAFNVDIVRDENGAEQQLNVSFDNPERPTYLEMYMDSDRVQELKDYYEQLHSNSSEESQ